MTHLSDKAVLVHLGISQWLAKKLDKRASAEVARVNGAANNAGRYNKSLLPTCQLLDDVKKKTGEIRQKFYRNTLPWGIEGTFILPSANYLTFMNDFRKEKASWEIIVAAFIDEYPYAKLAAERLLGGLYNARDYPAPSELRDKFKMAIAVLPVPSENDFRVDLTESEYDSVKADIERRVADSSKAAMKDVWQRLYDKVAWLAERLGDPDHIFRDGAYNDAKDTCQLLSKLNFADDPDLESMRAEVERKLVSHHPDSLRHDKALRSDTAAQAEDIMARMGAFMG